MAAQAYYHRAIVRLARGQGGAVEDVERGLELAEAAEDPQVVNPARAVAGHVFWSVGERDRAKAMLGTFTEGGRRPAEGGMPSGLCELGWLALDLGSADRFLEALADAPPSLWVDASGAIARVEPVRAAEILDRIGAKPEAAYARLRSGEPAELERAVAFYRSVGAARYIHECEQLLAATA
jgi:hypothetical protein